MRKPITLCLVGAALLFGSGGAHGQQARRSFYVYFPAARSAVDTTCADNGRALTQLRCFLDSVRADSTRLLTAVQFCGLASPDGGPRLNARLAASRSRHLEEWVRSRCDIPDSVVSHAEGGIGWEALTQMVEASDMPHRDEALRVLRDVPEATYDARGVLTDSRKHQLMNLRGGRTWFWMRDHFFARVRNACSMVAEVRQLPAAPQVEESKADTILYSAPADTAAADTILYSESTGRPFYMALKTNALYDVLAVPNLGVEFWLGKGWTVGADWKYAWWSSDRRHRYWRTYGGGLVLRRYFGQKAEAKPLTGHHLGLEARVLTYDFEWNGKGHMGGLPGGTLWDRMNYTIGLAYGYAMPVARRLNIDFGLAVGYMGGKYCDYEPRDGHYVWLETKRHHYFGPTNVEISLVWLLGHGNTNTKR